MAFRVLIVANGFVQGAPDSFPADVRRLFEQDHEVRVLVPTRTGRLAWLTSDTGRASGEASALVSETLADMRRQLTGGHLEAVATRGSGGSTSSAWSGSCSKSRPASVMRTAAG